MIGKINSICSLGTVDGPGIRFVVFLQGCNLRCGCCHNPETWNISDGKEFESEEILNKVVRCKEYFKETGGITISGGEPLLQAKFVTDIFKRCHQVNINTCLDTSGSILNDDVKELLTHTDIVLLDIKYTNELDYNKYVLGSYNQTLSFLKYLNDINKRVIIRQVIIPTLNDNYDNIDKLIHLKNTYKCIEKIELLPFKKICQSKYDSLNIDFKFKDFEVPSMEIMENLNNYLNK